MLYLNIVSHLDSKNNYMKLMLKFILSLSLFILVLVIGCKKDFSLENQTQNSNAFTSKDAREWFYTTFKKSAAFNEYNDSTLKLPDWAHSTYRKVGNLEIIEFPLFKEKKSIIIQSNNRLSSNDKKRLLGSSLFRISFIKSANGEISIREIDYIPSFDYLKLNNYDISNLMVGKKNKFNFSGIIITKKWGGEVLSKRVFTNGKIVGSLNPYKKTNIEIKKNTSQSSQAQECYTLEFCTETEVCLANMTNSGDFISWSVPADCHYVYTDCETQTYCSDPDDPEDPNDNPTCEYNSSETCECQLLNLCDGGNGGGGGGAGSSNNVSVTSVTETIDSNLPCLKDAFNSVTGVLLTNCINRLYQDTYVGTNNVHNLEVTTAPNLYTPSGIQVEAKSKVKNNDANTYQIFLNSDLGHQYTEEFWSSVILHELVHSFIQKNNLNFTPTAQFSNSYEIMLTKWVNRIKEALMEIYAGMTENDALCLSINGMSDILLMDETNTFKGEMILFMEQHYNQNATTLGATATAYKNGTKGTQCN